MSDRTAARLTLAEFRALPETTTPTEPIDGELIGSAAPKTPHQDALPELALLVRQDAYGLDATFVSPVLGEVTIRVATVFPGA